MWRFDTLFAVLQFIEMLCPYIYTKMRLLYKSRGIQEAFTSLEHELSLKFDMDACGSMWAASYASDASTW